MTLNAGDVLFIPASTVHAVRNVGIGPASELATYAVEKGGRSSPWFAERAGTTASLAGAQTQP